VSIWKGIKKIFALWGRRKTKPIQSQSPDIGVREAGIRERFYQGSSRKEDSGPVRRDFARKICEKQAFLSCQSCFIGVESIVIV